MTKEDIMAMARRAGAHDDGNEVRFVELRYLERFAALVAAAQRPDVDALVALARADERERIKEENQRCYAVKGKDK